jgi:ferredoxin-type protein NapH
VKSRQRVRKAILIASMLLLPITLFYFSPYLIVDGAFQGVVAGGAVAFLGLLVASVVLGRGFCGWVCGAGAVQEVLFLANDRRARGGRLNWIKFAIWVPWLGAIAAGFVLAGGAPRVDPFHKLGGWISTGRPEAFAVFYTVLGALVAMSLLWGRRAFCHYGCWICPFMIVGTAIRDALRLPGLRLACEPDKCIHCKLCTRECPMSLDVEAMVAKANTRNTECILCGACADRCPKGALSLRFGTAK